MDVLNRSKFLRICLDGLEAMGYSLEQVADKDEGEKRAAELRDKARSAPFSLQLHDFTRSELFWLFLQKDGCDVGCAVARVHTIQPGELVGYIRSSHVRFHGDNAVDLDLPVPRLIDAIAGRVAYLGEFYLDEAHRGTRNLLRLYTHSLFIVACESLRADWMYAFCPREHDSFGLARVYGFQIYDDTVLVWKDLPEGRRREVFCAISAEQLSTMSIHYVKYPGDFRVTESART